jgi:hypothetical protein
MQSLPLILGSLGIGDLECRQQRSPGGSKGELFKVKFSCLPQIIQRLRHGFALSRTARFWIEGDVATFRVGCENCRQSHDVHGSGSAWAVNSALPYLVAAEWNTYQR